jgi:hypothetical protein
VIRVAILATLATGCATMADVAYLIGGPKTRGDASATAHGTGRIDHHREIAIAPREGIVCRDIETPYVTSSSITTSERHPNGYKAVMQLFTALEGGITAVTFGAIEVQCATNPAECVENREKLYLYSIPLFADILWGVYRSLTIHNAIVRESRVTWRGDATPTQGTTLASSCAPGTEVPLYAETEQLVVHVGEHGRVVEAEAELLLRFVIAHPQFSIGGDFKFDSKGVADLAAFARAKLAPPPAAVVRDATTTTTTTTTVEVPSQLCIETPLAAACVHAAPPPPPPPPPSDPRVRDHR